MILSYWKDEDVFDVGYPSGLFGCRVYTRLRVSDGLEGNPAYYEKQTAVEEPLHLYDLGRDFIKSHHRHYRMVLP